MIRIYRGSNSFIEVPDFESVYRFLNNYRGKHLSIRLNDDVTNEVVRELIIRSLRTDKISIFRGGFGLGGQFAQHTCVFKSIIPFPFPNDNDPNFFHLTKLSGNSVTYVGNFNNLKFLLDFEIQKVREFKNKYILTFNNFKLHFMKKDKKCLTLLQRLLISHPLLVKNINKTKLSTNLVKEFFRYFE